MSDPSTTAPGAPSEAKAEASGASPPPAPAPATAAAPVPAEESGPASSAVETENPQSGGQEADPAHAPLPPNLLPASHWAQIQPEEDEEDDGDSAYGADNASSTASLSASIFEYRTIQGRSFHSERGSAQSWNPNDAQHDESMDILHHVSTLQEDGKLFMAELGPNVQKVLDAGCGTGLWAIDFADQYPSAEVIGLDISPQQPSWLPPNLKFEIDDMNEEWTYPPNTFDYVHMRWLIGALPDWNYVCRQIFKVLKPGAIFESKESSAMITSDDGTVSVGSALDQWGRVFWEAGKKFGRSFRVYEDDIQRKAMEAAGFVDLKVYEFKTPLGVWPQDEKLKEVGIYAKLALEQDIEGFVVYMWSTVMGWSKDEIQVYAAHLRRELRSGKHHPWFPQRVVVGRKPETAE